MAHLCVARSPDQGRCAITQRDGIADIHYRYGSSSARPSHALPDPYSLPATEQAVAEILTPFFPELDEDEISHVCGSLERFESPDRLASEHGTR